MARLTHQQFYQLCEWVKKVKDGLIAAKPTQQEIAAQATEELDIPFTDAQVSDALETVGIYEQVATSQAKNLKQSNKARMEVRIMARALAEFFRHVKYKPCAEFEQLVSELPAAPKQQE